MKKTCKALLFTALMVLICLSAANAADGQEEVDMEAAKAAFCDTIVNVKSGATNVTDIVLEMERSVRDQDVYGIITSLRRTKTPTDFKQDGGMECLLTFTDGSTKTVVVSYKSTVPVLKFKTDLKAISATDTQNSSNTALLAYVNSSLDLVAEAAEEYEKALGTAPVYTAAKFTWNAANYYAKGGFAYIFTQVYMGQTLTRRVMVNAVSSKAPSIVVDYDNGTVNTTRDLKYSLDRSAWSTCSDEMLIPDKWQGERVYFYRPATTYADESATTYVDVPYRADTPSIRPKLTATSHSIVVTNVWDYNKPQFSLDGKSWRSSTKSSFVFDDLSANTQYTVYVREGGSTKQLASKNLTQGISTGKRIVTGVDVSIQKNEKIQITTAIATIKPEIYSKTLSGSLAADDFVKLKAITKEAYDAKYSVFSDLSINQVVEENENKEITNTKFTMPMSALSDVTKYSSVGIDLNTPVTSVFLSNQTVAAYKNSGTLTVNMNQVTTVPSSSSAYSFLKKCLDNEAPVFNITVKNSSYPTREIRYYLPYELGSKERLESLNVYHMDEKGVQTELCAVYNDSRHSLVFTTAKTGYFAIVQDNSSSLTMPYTDMKDHWACNYVSYCSVNGIFNGISNDSFAPNMEISRCMIVTLLARMDGADKSDGVSPSEFVDIKGDEWYAHSVQWALQNNIVDRQGERFNPSSGMSREEIACAIANYLKYKGLLPDAARSAGYVDSKNISSLAVASVDALAELGVMTGVDGNKFLPDGTMTRAEMATILYRLSKIS